MIGWKVEIVIFFEIESYLVQVENIFEIKLSYLGNHLDIKLVQVERGLEGGQNQLYYEAFLHSYSIIWSLQSCQYVEWSYLAFKEASGGVLVMWETWVVERIWVCCGINSEISGEARLCPYQARFRLHSFLISPSWVLFGSFSYHGLMSMIFLYLFLLPSYVFYLLYIHYTWLPLFINLINFYLWKKSLDPS